MIKEIAGKISAGVVICKIINVYSEANNQQVCGYGKGNNTGYSDSFWLKNSRKWG